jgi:CubicO group peptidase (beta-lactamase class C family)
MQNPGSDAGVFVLVSSSHPPAKNAPSIRLGPCIGGGDDLAEQPDEFTVSAGGAPFQGNVGNLFWGGITGPRYLVDPKEKLVGIVFAQRPVDPRRLSCQTESDGLRCDDFEQGRQVATDRQQGRNGFLRPAIQDDPQRMQTPAAMPGSLFGQTLRTIATAQRLPTPVATSR